MNTKKPTPLFWSIASLAGFAITFLAATFLMRSSTTTQLGLTGAFYFIILVALGCSAALLLFGALRGFAKYTGHVMSGTLEIGGPIVVAALTVVGGYVFRPDVSRPLVVRVLGPTSELVCPESVQLELGQDIRPGELGKSACQAQFNEVPAKFFTTSGLIVRVKAEGYEAVSSEKYGISSDGVIEVRMRKVQEHSAAWGRLVSPRGSPVTGAAISVNGEQRGVTDGSGQFRFEVPLREGRTAQLTVTLGDHRVVYDSAVTLPIAATLRVEEAQ